MLYSTNEKVEDAKNYNEKCYKQKQGCIGKLACEGCNTIIGNSGCFCANQTFICPVCGFNNESDYIKTFYVDCIDENKYYKCIDFSFPLIYGFVYKIHNSTTDSNYVITEELGKISFPKKYFTEATEEEVENTKQKIKRFINEYNIPKDGSVNVYFAYWAYPENQTTKEENIAIIERLGL